MLDYVKMRSHVYNEVTRIFTLNFRRLDATIYFLLKYL